jgi:hypothetical protein
MLTEVSGGLLERLGILTQKAQTETTLDSYDTGPRIARERWSETAVPSAAGRAATSAKKGLRIAVLLALHIPQLPVAVAQYVELSWSTWDVWQRQLFSDD